MNNLLIISLVLLPLIGSIIGFAISKKFEKVREILFISITTIEFILVLILDFTFKELSVLEIPGILGLGLSFKADEFRCLYASISIFLWLMTIIFSKEYMHHYSNKNRYYFFYLLTLCGVVGLFLSNDLYTTFVFFEIMSLASYPLVIHDEKEESMNAGKTYLAVAIISGMILLVGIFLLYSQSHNLSFDGIREYAKNNGISGTLFVSGLLMLLGFGAKAGMYPLHIWLPKAHPVAPAPASALLSGILTKSGIFGIILVSTNIFLANYDFAMVLLIFAVITMFLGALLGLFSTNLKRTLACSSMSQIGFILVGVSFVLLLGEEGSLAQSGALLHMANHSLIKLVLFMAAGVVAMNTHKLDLNDIKGYGRKKYFLMIIFLIAALSIMGIPGFAGYGSKTMIHESIVEYIHHANLSGSNLVLFKSIEYIFLLSGGLTVGYMSKLFVCLFIQKNNDPLVQEQFDNNKDYLSLLSKVVFVLSAASLVVIGILPNLVTSNIISACHEFFNVERLTETIHFFSLENLKGAAISIGFGVAFYLLNNYFMIKDNKYVNLWPNKLELEKLIYKPVIVNGTLIITNTFFKFISESFDVAMLFIRNKVINTVIKFVSNAFDNVVYFFKEVVFKEKVYQFDPSHKTHKIGVWLDKVFHTNKYANKLDSIRAGYKDEMEIYTNSFSYAFAMISFGIILVLGIVIIINLKTL